MFGKGLMSLEFPRFTTCAVRLVPCPRLICGSVSAVLGRKWPIGAQDVTRTFGVDKALGDSGVLLTAGLPTSTVTTDLLKKGTKICSDAVFLRRVHQDVTGTLPVAVFLLYRRRELEYPGFMPRCGRSFGSPLPRRRSFPAAQRSLQPCCVSSVRCCSP